MIKKILLLLIFNQSIYSRYNENFIKHTHYFFTNNDLKALHIKSFCIMLPVVTIVLYLLIKEHDRKKFLETKANDLTNTFEQVPNQQNTQKIFLEMLQSQELKIGSYYLSEAARIKYSKVFDEERASNIKMHILNSIFQGTIATTGCLFYLCILSYFNKITMSQN